MAAASPAKSKIDHQIDVAMRLHLDGQLKQAQKQYARILKKAPGNSRILSLMGGLLLQTGDYQKAAEYLRRACAKNVADADLPYNLGLALYHLQQYEIALNAFREAVQMNPRHDRAHYMMATTFLEWDKKRFRSEALNAYLRDVEINDRLESLVVIAELLQDQGKNEEARGVAKQILAKDPGHEIGLFVLAKTLIAENYDKALVDIKYAEPIIKAGNLILKLHPGSWRGHHVIAEALAMIGENDLSLEHYRKVNEIVPGYAISRTNTGILLLRRGHLREGWEEISHRKHHGAEIYGMHTDILDRCPAPFWEGQLTAGSRLLIASEQGIGDQIMHSQMLRELLDAGVSVSMTCTDKIVPLMARSLPQVQFYGQEQSVPQAELDLMDYKAELLDLGKYLRDDITKFGNPFYFLKPDPALMKEFKHRYQQFGQRLKVGISWRSISRSVGSIKSTELKQWGEILCQPGIEFINIQYGPVDQELAEVKNLFGVDIYREDFDPFNDIEKATAQISALDLVISVSNASVHLAGQLNIPTWVMLNSRPLWHWFEQSDRTVWYESLKLYRQSQLQSWDPVISQVAEDLATFSMATAAGNGAGGE
ncbi:MAG: tetratricopeptide repeat protein [Pseudomonadota bacterium]|nr:tetratricopeptide repeat protein [Pseudomonadota bacterium]